MHDDLVITRAASRKPLSIALSLDLALFLRIIVHIPSWKTREEFLADVHNPKFFMSLEVEIQKTTIAKHGALSNLAS
jgi:hypothetical protein